MPSNNYNYNYTYHQQSSAKQYPSYQTAPPNPTTKPSRQYQKAPSAALAQPADYGLYPGTLYGTAGTGYGAAQDNTWSGGASSYGTASDNGSRAAEVLHNMSNTGYAAATTTTEAPRQSGFTATNTAHYAPGRSPQVQAQPTQPSRAAYGHTQARPRSVDTNQAQASANRGLSSPATTAGYPAPRAPPHYPDYTQRHLDTDTSRSSHSVLPPTSSFVSQVPAHNVQPPSSGIHGSYAGSSTTVDPTAVYDPWPEYERQRAIKDAERAEREKREEDARKETERLEEERRKQKEAEEEARQAQQAAAQPKPKAKTTQKQQAPAPPPVPAETSGASADASTLEAEIRAMMAKMRELNGKDPQLLARIWEEERKAKAPVNKSPTATMRPAPQAPIAVPAPVPTPPIANQRKKATPRDSLSTPVAKPATPARDQAAPTRAPIATPVRSGGTTIWPAEKKLELAKAAAYYLTTKNPDRPFEDQQVLQMLDGNPSYVELCEQLEQMGFKLDRSTFAKSLLSAVPDVNSASRRTSSQTTSLAVTPKAPALPAIMKYPAPAAVMRHPVATPVAPRPRYAPATASPMDSPSYPPFPSDNATAAPPPIPVAEMIPIKPELKPPANKEQAARKRNLSELVDLTQLDDEDDMGPPMKRFNRESMHPDTAWFPHSKDAMNVDTARISNFPTASTPVPMAAEPKPHALPVAMPPSELRYRSLVEPLDKKKALRRNTYNPATIARDVLLACGRHPFERQLNQHLDVLKTHIPQISNDSDLSTIRWDLIDPGNPPPGYFKDSVQSLLEDADDEDESGDEDGEKVARQGSQSAQALPAATNPFIKQKQRGRPPRHSLPNTTTPSTPSRKTDSASMSASAPRPTAVPGVGYSAFRQIGPDGNLLPKKKGRPVGWRKAIHGSAAAQQRPSIHSYKPRQPSTLHNVRADEEPIVINSRSPSVANHASTYQSFKCKWQHCNAELHNFETLKMHVFKVHQKETLQQTFVCLWDDCSEETTTVDPASNMSLEQRTPHTFTEASAWRDHIRQHHFDPLVWERGDGPAGGLSDAHDSEAYLSDAQGRRVTPRVTASPADFENVISPRHIPGSAPHGRGRPAKSAQEQEARDTQDRLVSQKRRLGGPGMDRGGATLVNDKRRRGLVDSDGTEEELVDAED
ncbi:hypothetical protein OPT61_g8283 [Boeremia exigua]|uniref:Uncharacterized protein n=1 Tax=Boeremia exigua TaxID=749465 RepID=A0ACC2HYT7_9PLEO|nr:hypothetical protein OPT61_g8283 [Boeremia exigua]